MTSLRSRFVSRRVALSALVALLGIATQVQAVSPTINTITPPGGRRGTEMEVRITGVNLSDNPQLVLYGPGIKVKEIGPLKDKRTGSVIPGAAVAVLDIAADCRLGAHPLRVRTDTGLTPQPLLFTVGSLPETAEVEPNNDSAAPQAVPLESTIVGVIQAEDVDYFTVDLKKGEPLAVEVEALRLGRTIIDPFITILDSDKRELARSDDEAFGWYDAVASVVAPRDGKYLVMLREVTFGGSGNAAYRLHIGRFPRPTAMIPAGGRPGQKLEVTYLGEARGPWKQTITVPTKAEFYSTMNPGDQKGTAVYPQDERGTAPTPLVFRMTDLDNVLEAEPNDDPAQASTAAAVPTALNGVIEKPGDVDHFRIKTEKGVAYDVRVHARSIRSPLDSVLTITRASNGSSAGTNDDSGTPDSYLRLSGTGEEFILQVKDMLSQGGANFVYRIEVTPIEPQIALSVAEEVRYIDTICEVPQGNRGAVVLNVAKRDFAGELTLSVPNLPKGMKFATVPVAPNQTVIPFVLSADENAPLGPGILDVQAKSSDPKTPAFGRLSQATMLLQSNQRTVYQHTIQRMSSAVTKKAPFSIEVETPKVPLVRNGSMDLKVRAKRAPGFTSAINIRMLYNPNGTAAAVAAQIPEGKDEGLLFINAGSTAEVRQWQIVVVASAPYEGGTIEVSSDLVPLQVGDPYFELVFKAPGSVEQGKEFQFTIPVNNLVEFAGKAKLQLVGLPDEAVCEPIEITQDDTQAVFTVKTTSKTPVGRHKAIMCNLVVMKDGEPINHALGPGEIRVDPPTKTRSAVAAAGGAKAPGSAAKPGEPSASKPTAAQNNQNNK